MAATSDDTAKRGRDLNGLDDLQGERRRPDHTGPDGEPAPIVLAVDPAQPDPAIIRRAADVIVAGGLVAFPTETVYGLGANALDPAAVARIFEAKGRPAEDPLIVHVLDAAALAPLVTHLPDVAARLAAAFWPGPLTLVVPRSKVVPDAVTAGLDTVAIRSPSHPVARELIRAAGTPIAAPSANPFGRTSPTTAQHVVDDLDGRVDLVLDGGSCPIGVESTVVDCTSNPPRVLRHGGVPIEDLREIVDVRADNASATTAISAPLRRKSPGTYSRHYAPLAKLILITGPPAALREAMRATAARLETAGERVGLLVADEDLVGTTVASPFSEATVVIVIAGLSQPEVAARNLFAALRELDAAGATVILARDFGDRGLWHAVRDRLSRAAEGRVVEVESGQIEAAVAAIVALIAADDLAGSTARTAE